MATENQDTNVTFETVDGAAAKATANNFLEKNGKIFGGIAAAFIVLIGGYYLYYSWVQKPHEEEGQNSIYLAQMAFARDSFQLALDGPADESFLGFLDVIEEYSGTDAANIAHYYAGASFLHLGNADQAITFLSEYSGGDQMTQAMVYSMLGDAYSDQGSMDEAISNYEKAASTASNGAISPYVLRKAGLLSEHNNNMEAAKKYFEQAQNEYPLEAKRLGIEKDLIRVTGVY